MTLKVIRHKHQDQVFSSARLTITENLPVLQTTDIISR